MANPCYIVLYLAQPAGNIGSFTADDNGRATFQLVSDKVKVTVVKIVVNITFSYTCVNCKHHQTPKVSNRTYTCWWSTPVKFVL